MKNQTKSNLSTALQSLGIIFMIFFAMAFTCKNNDRNELSSQPDSAETNGAFPQLPGTAWKIDFGKGVTGNVFLFCKTGRWEVVPADNRRAGMVGKSYTVTGNTLTTVNADDGMVEKWKMSWQDDVLVLNDGKQTLKLHYNGETQCK